MVNVWGGKDGRSLHKRLVRRWEQWTRKWEPLVPDSMSGAVTGMLIPVSGGLLTLFLLWGLLRTLHIRTIYADSHRGSESKQLAALLDHGADRSSRLAGDVEFGLSDSQDVELTASGAGKKRPPADDLRSENGDTERQAGKVDKSKKKKLKQKKSKKKSGHLKGRSKEFGEPDGTPSSSGKKTPSKDRGKQGKEGKRKGKGKKKKPQQRDISSSLLDSDAGDVLQETEVSEEID